MTNSSSLSRICIVGFLFLLVCSAIYAQGPTAVASISGTTPTLIVSQSTLATAFAQEFNDGTTVNTSSIAVVYNSTLSAYYLTGTATLTSGKTATIWTQLDRISNQAFIQQTSGGTVQRCFHPACSYSPCTLPPNCSGQCYNNGVECELVTDGLAVVAYLGSLY